MVSQEGDDILHCFGNVALITVSGNSKFSNYYPDGKVKNFNEIIQQSPKLKIMASYILKYLSYYLSLIENLL